MLFKKRERLKLDQVRSLVPLRAPAAEWRAEGEEIKIVIRRSEGLLPRVLALFFTVPAVKAFTLDKFGAEVWKLVDGTNSVGEVMRRFPLQSGWVEERKEAAVLQFLTMLSEKRLINFGPPRRPPGGPG